jgi:hypothetical protein
MNIRVPKSAFEAGILDERHEALIRKLERLTKRAGIDPHWVWTSAKTGLNQNLHSYLRRCLSLLEPDLRRLLHRPEGHDQHHVADGRGAGAELQGRPNDVGPKSHVSDGQEGGLKWQRRVGPISTTSCTG